MLSEGEDEVLEQVTLSDKYTLESGRVFMTGTQALVRLPMNQRQRDLKAGLNTAGYVSGYQGSPISGLDIALTQAGKYLDEHHVHFHPGLNEDLAAAALWGTQQLDLYPDNRYDGVFGMWYGKGPGVDRTGDAFVHANAAGTGRHGGVLVIAGDDHAARTTTTPHQSAQMFSAAMIPSLNPVDVQDYLDLGIHGIAMSRYSGLWVGFTSVCDNIESSASVDVDPHRVKIRLPEDYLRPADGLNIRWPDSGPAQEARTKEQRLAAALAYVRANGLDRTIIDQPKARFGIVTTGKASADVLEALEMLGIDEGEARAIGLRVYRVTMAWPLEPQGIAQFAEGLEEVLVVEEKRPVIEEQIKEQLYNLPDAQRPRVVGKYDGKGNWEGNLDRWLLPSTSELTPAMIARVIAARIAPFFTSDKIKRGLAVLDRREETRTRLRDMPIDVGSETLFTKGRLPYYCSGCPHNTSTHLPDGSRSQGGIGCHFMVMWMDRNTTTFCHMGAEGAAWNGQAPFTNTEHVFANLGDGTYLHSGILAIRAAVAADVNITYKLLFNGSVAMTGGQPLAGSPTVPQITRQLAAENVARIVVVTDDPDKYPANAGFAPGIPIRHRDEIDQVQLELRETRGASILIYDQACATERRRQRKRGKAPAAPRRLWINPEVCEGCGDCNSGSNCLAILPLETMMGRKRVIDQSSCNTDYSCLKGFCPSFVSVEDGTPLAGQAADTSLPAVLPEPKQPDTETPYGLMIAGIGGSGVMTLGAIIGAAAHMEGKGVTVLDMTGLAQRWGAATSYVRIADKPGDIKATRIPLTAEAVIGGDIAVVCEPETTDRLEAGHSRMVVNTSRAAEGEFTNNPDLDFPVEQMKAKIEASVGQGSADYVDAAAHVNAVLGNTVLINVFMLGFAFQQGLVPVSAAALEQAIALNGVMIEENLLAFRWGRSTAHDPQATHTALGLVDQIDPSDISLDELIENRARHLVDYQNQTCAGRYRDLVQRVRVFEVERFDGGTGMTTAVAKGYAKLLACKDEYEVARLYSLPSFQAGLKATFENASRFKIHLAPPLMTRSDPVSGLPRKIEFGPWILPFLRMFAGLKGIRGTVFDPFGYTKERRRERLLITQYEALVSKLLEQTNNQNYAAAIEILSLPDIIRGYGPVKKVAMARAKTREAELLQKHFAVCEVSATA